MLKKFFMDESGASMVEYGLLVALIAIIAIAATQLLGQQVSTTFSGAADAMQQANTGS